MNYYNEIEHYIKKNEISKKYHEIASSKEDLENKWNIGRLIVEAQGGSKIAKYGNELIKKWSVKLTIKYGKGFDRSNLKRFRLFYELFPKGGPPAHQLTWSHIQYLLPIKDESKRNYYINQIIERNLSKRTLIEAIKTKEYERLINKPDKIEIKPQDKGQIESYMKVVDKEIKETFHNKTIGIIISKKNNRFIAEFIKSSNIYALTYQIA